MQKIRKGDDVVVIAGRDKGRRGAVIKVLDDGRVLVENVNMVKKHQRGNPQSKTRNQGGIIEREAPLQISNVALWNPATKKGDRIGVRMLADGKRVRFFKSNKEVVDT